MSYVDGFVFPVKREKLESFRKMAEVGKTVWMDHGALDYKECVIDLDDKPTEEHAMHTLNFAQVSGAKEGEVTVFSYIVFRDKLHRDEVNAKVMADPRMNPEEFDKNDMPMEPQRMAYGGFVGLVEA